ncbi:MAG: sigma-70 family RNA polymerase sigma factor [Sedimentisphaerales bacterium]|nr:sigma-70 family RNA polymerase sigma factor [Sedimentisphaerales bacterium]
MAEDKTNIHSQDPTITQRFIELYELNRKRILGFILTLVPSWSHAEDIMQETSELMWKQFADTEPITNFAAWGISIARFKILEYRRRNCQEFIQFNDEILLQLAEEALEKEKDVPDYIQALRKCRKKLDKQAQALLELRYEKGIPVKHIGEHVGRTLKSLYRDLARIHAQLHSCVKRTLAEGNKCLVTDKHDLAVDLPGALGEIIPGDDPRAALQYEICLLGLEMLDGVISEERFARLEFLLAVSPERLKFYVEFILMCVGFQSFLEPTFLNKTSLDRKVNAFLSQMPCLEDSSVFLEVVEKDLHDSAVRQGIQDAEARRLELEEARLQNMRTIKPRFGRQELFRGLLRIAAVVLVATAIIWLDRMLYRKEAPEILARLTGVDNSQWAGTPAPLTLGCDLMAGPLELQKGLAEITFANGAKVILEAPTRIYLNKDDELYLEKGKITATASGSAVGFAVNTDNARVVDLGTEFGVSAVTGGATDVQVYRGEVALISDWEKNSFQADDKTSMKLPAGQARRINADHTVVEIKHNELAFVRPEEFSVRQQAQCGDAYARWRTWSYMVRRDPDLVVYYPFEQNLSEPETLYNHAAATSGRLNGAIYSENAPAVSRWVPGRWPDMKKGLHFERDRKQPVIVPADADFCLRGDITIAVWLRCPEMEKIGHIISNRHLREVNYQVAFSRQKNLHFIRYNEASAGNRAYSRELPDLTDEWHLLAFTYNNREVTFYLDGETFQEVPYGFNYSPPVLADLIIGDVEENIAEADILRFNGDMDEIAVFQRILSSEEIRTMYMAGKPD